MLSLQSNARRDADLTRSVLSKKGSCGDYNSDSALIVALNTPQNPAQHCGDYVLITNTANGKQVKAKVADSESLSFLSNTLSFVRGTDLLFRHVACPSCSCQ